MSRGVKIVIGIIVVIVLLCGAVMLFVNWANSDEGQATMNEVSTQQAVASATGAVQTQQASGTATATWSEIEARLQRAELVYENTFEEDTPMLTPYGEDLDPYYRDGIPELIVAWNGFTILPIGKSLKDFVAEIDCAANGAFCGIAYSVNKDSEGKDIFYASGIGNADQFFFDDRYASLPSSKWKGENFPPSTAEGLLHHIRLERFGEIMRFYVNGQLMDERLIDNPEAATGDVGFYFGKASDESGIQTIHVDNFRVWELP